MPRIDYYFSVLSPYAYLAGLGLEEIAARHGASITYMPLDIIALFGLTGGTPPRQRHPARQEYRLQELRRASARTGLKLNLKPAFWPTDPLPASKAVIACAAAGGPTGLLAHALLAACWAEERDIADPGVVAEVLEGSGIDAAALAPHLADAEEAYHANLGRAAAAGVFGAPFYIVGEERFWGCDRLDALDRHLAEG